MTLGLRERKKLATRQALHVAALQLVAERGVEGVSADDIADRAGVSQRTFFNYFATKDDAIIELNPTSGGDLAAAFAARPEGEPAIQALQAVLQERVTGMSWDTELWRLRMQVIDANPSLAARLALSFGESERALAAAIAVRTGTRVDVDVYPSLLAAVQGVVMRTSLHRWLASGFTSSLPELVDQAWCALTSGLQEPSTD